MGSLSNLERAEKLKDMVAKYCTGGGSSADELAYAQLRREFLREPEIAGKLPHFIRACRNLQEVWDFIKPKFAHYVERREFVRTEFESLLSMLEIESPSPSDVTISETVKAVSSEYITEVWKKALERRATDPEGAITLSRTLLESVCKHILDAATVNYDADADLPRLYTRAAKQLNLSPSQHTEQLFKQILGGCQTVVEGLGALRNRHSDAHGKGIAGTRPAPRHAELAVNLAGTMATFLLQTWESRK